MTTDRFLPPDTGLLEPVTQQELLNNFDKLAHDTRARIETLTRERDGLLSRVLTHLTERHVAHEAGWGVDARECRHPSCSNDVRALQSHYERFDRVLAETGGDR